jgi:hypothetical protein
MRFGLRSMFVVVTIFALLAGGIGWLRYAYYVQVRKTKAVLAEFPQIDRVWFVTNDDVHLEVEIVYFSVTDQPGLILESLGIDHASKALFRQRLQEALRERVPVNLPSYAEEYLQ